MDKTPHASAEEDGTAPNGPTPPRMHGISELLELFQQLFALGYGPGLVNLRVSDIPLRVQDERGALVHAPFLVEHAIGFAGRAVRPVVREQRERNAAQFLGPPLEAGRGVGADIQDLAVQLLEFFVVRTEPVDLVRSPAGEGEGHERNHDRPSAETGERNLLVGVRGEREIRRHAAGLNCHERSPFSKSQRSMSKHTRTHGGRQFRDTPAHE